jgi:hypothetical protein
LKTEAQVREILKAYEDVFYNPKTPKKIKDEYIAFIFLIRDILEDR